MDIIYHILVLFIKNKKIKRHWWYGQQLLRYRPSVMYIYKYKCMYSMYIWLLQTASSMGNIYKDIA